MPPPPGKELVLRSPDGRDVLRLRALRRDAGYPSLEVRAEGSAKGFSGGGEVWLDGFELKAFAAALREFDRARQGRLELKGMTPDDFRLVLRSLDGAGHLLVEFAIARSMPAGDRPENAARLAVSGAFDLDPGTVGEIAAGFAQLARAVAA